MPNRCRECTSWWFGACIGEAYCREERDGLYEESERQTSQRGHVMGELSKDRGYATWRAQCVNCGREAAISLHPGPGEAAVFGQALTEQCPSPPAEQVEAQPDADKSAGRGLVPSAESVLR